MTTNEQDQAALDRWNEYAPMVPSVEPENRAEFFATAPTGTVVELWDDLYKRVPSGMWMHLEELVFAGNSYSEYREHETSPAEHMVTLASEFTTVRVLRLGEGPGWN